MKSALLTYRLLHKNPFILASLIARVLVFIVFITLDVTLDSDLLFYLPLVYCAIITFAKIFSRNHYYFMTNTLRVRFKDILLAELIFMVEVLIVNLIVISLTDIQLVLFITTFTYLLSIVNLLEIASFCYIGNENQIKFYKLKKKYFNKVEDGYIKIILILILFLINPLIESSYFLHLSIYLLLYSLVFHSIYKTQYQLVT